MYHLSLKHFEHSLGHMVHDERFWGVVALIILLGFIILSVWMSPRGSTGTPPSTFFGYY